jgi:hypothetical protein
MIDRMIRMKKLFMLMSKFQVRQLRNSNMFVLSCKRLGSNRSIVIRRSVNRDELLQLKKLYQKAPSFGGELPGFMLNGL